MHSDMHIYSLVPAPGWLAHIAKYARDQVLVVGVQENQPEEYEIIHNIIVRSEWLMFAGTVVLGVGGDKETEKKPRPRWEEDVDDYGWHVTSHVLDECALIRNRKGPLGLQQADGLVKSWSSESAHPEIPLSS